eukprot:6185189-Pleurochrysis_carterae.AAC.2
MAPQANAVREQNASASLRADVVKLITDVKQLQVAIHLFRSFSVRLLVCDRTRSTIRGSESRTRIGHRATHRALRVFSLPLPGLNRANAYGGVRSV